MAYPDGAATAVESEEIKKSHGPVYRVLSKIYVQVFIGLILGVVVGVVVPNFGASLQPLGTAFISLIKMIVGPIVFCVVVLGIASSSDVKSVGRVGMKALIYFEVVSVIALVIGVIFAELFRPGDGMHVDPDSLDANEAGKYNEQPVEGGIVGFLMHIIPENPVSAFAEGDILQILFFSVIFGVALLLLGHKYRPVVIGVQLLSDVLFKILAFVMRLAPIGAFGALAFTVGAYGLGTLKQLGFVLVIFYAACAFFLIFVVGGVALYCRVNLIRLIVFFRDEILITLGTESTEAVMPQCMVKLKRLGCPDRVTSLSFPAGYSFNLDGASIYLAMGVLFIAQATDVHLSFVEIGTILMVAFVTHHGGAGVSGAVFFILAATLQAVGTLPVAGIALLLGIDRLMNELRSVTNLIGNIVATIFICRWEGVLDSERMTTILSRKRSENFRHNVVQ